MSTLLIFAAVPVQLHHEIKCFLYYFNIAVTVVELESKKKTNVNMAVNIYNRIKND